MKKLIQDTFIAALYMFGVIMLAAVIIIGLYNVLG